MSEGRCRFRDGGSIAFDVSGTRGAPPILLLRPLGGTRALWGAFRGALDARLRTIAFDPRPNFQKAAGLSVRWTTVARCHRRMTSNSRYGRWAG